MTPSDVLRQARALIADPKRWCQRVGRSGERRCALTALKDAYRRDSEAVHWRAIDYLYHAAKAVVGRESVIHVNDIYGHATVLRMYDEAIRLAEAAEGRGE